VSNTLSKISTTSMKSASTCLTFYKFDLSRSRAVVFNKIKFEIHKFVQENEPLTKLLSFYINFSTDGSNLQYIFHYRCFAVIMSTLSYQNYDEMYSKQLYAHLFPPRKFFFSYYNRSFFFASDKPCLSSFFLSSLSHSFTII